MLAVTDTLGAEVSSVEFGDHCLGEERRGHGTVVGSLVEVKGDGHRA